MTIIYNILSFIFIILFIIIIIIMANIYVSYIIEQIIKNNMLNIRDIFVFIVLTLGTFLIIGACVGGVIGLVDLIKGGFIL